MELVSECRICMLEYDGGEGQEILIQPCKCTSAYVHETCLQKWRNENRDDDKYNSCEICKGNYVILRDYPIENFEITATTRLKSCPLFCVYTLYLLSGTVLITAVDLLCNQLSVIILTRNNNIINIDDDNSLFWFMYYISYTSYIFSMMFFIHIFRGIKNHVHRKQSYIKKTRFKFGFCFMMCWTYFYNFYIFYEAMCRPDLYIGASAITVPMNFCIIKYVARIHDDTINELNDNNVETIRSVSYNPLNDVV